MVISLVKFPTTNTYIAAKKQDYYSLHVHLHSVCSIFQRMFCLYLFNFLSHLSPSHYFTNFIKSLSLLVSFLLNFRHGLSIDRSHIHLSIHKQSFYQEFQQISMRWSFGNSLRKVGHATSCGRNTVHNTGGSCHRPPNSPPNELHNTSCCRTIFQLNGAINK